MLGFSFHSHAQLFCVQTMYSVPRTILSSIRSIQHNKMITANTHNHNSENSVFSFWQFLASYLAMYKPTQHACNGEQSTRRARDRMQQMKGAALDGAAP